MSEKFQRSPLNTAFLELNQGNQRYKDHLEDFYFPDVRGNLMEIQYDKDRAVPNCMDFFFEKTRQKIESKCAVFKSKYKEKENTFGKFKEEIDQLFSEKKVKLPWSKINACEAFDLARRHLFPGWDQLTRY